MCDRTIYKESGTHRRDEIPDETPIYSEQVDEVRVSSNGFWIWREVASTLSLYAVPRSSGFILCLR